MNMNQNHVTFKQGKKLKELGFNELCSHAFSTKDTTGLKMKSVLDLALDVEMYKNEPLVNFNKYVGTYWDMSAPEQWQVIEWLLVKHDIWIYTRHFETFPFSSYVLQKGESMIAFNDDNKGFNSPQAAYSAAFDYILNNLLKD